MRMLDVEKLVTLRAVVAHGSFSSAAAAIGLTQPAVSRQVSILERRVGSQLVRRTRQGVYATEAGKLLVEHTDAIVDRLNLARAEVADIAGLRAGHVRLGAFFTAMVFLSAEVAALLELRHPALFTGRHQVIDDFLLDRRAALRALAAAEIDIAVVFEHDFDAAPPPPDIELVALFDDPLCVLLPVAHPLAAAESVHAAQLAADTWIRPRMWSAPAHRVLSDACRCRRPPRPLALPRSSAASAIVMLCLHYELAGSPFCVYLLARRGGWGPVG